jgi:hypothetical protein
MKTICAAVRRRRTGQLNSGWMTLADVAQLSGGG